MHIGFDGKRAFQNKTGLGNYSRSLLTILSAYYPQHQYTLFAPKETTLFDPVSNNIKVVTPSNFFGKKFRGWWRRNGIAGEITSTRINIYHGISNELPAGLHKVNVRQVVTVHDLIFERYPETYNFDERYTHRWKVKHACRNADTVIAISQQTRQDLIHYYNVPAEKITVCYQACNPVFQSEINELEKATVKLRYGLPDQFFLFVSSIAPRKNLITICKSMVSLKGSVDIPLVIIGDGKKEKEEVKQYMRENGMPDRLIFLNELPAAKLEKFISGEDFPAIYQQAAALIYPSIFEGFGLPVLEAMVSGTPVICSNTSSLPEVGGDAALYFSPMNYTELAAQMNKVVSDKQLVNSIKEKGKQQAMLFTPQRAAQSVMEVYEKLL